MRANLLHLCRVVLFFSSALMASPATPAVVHPTDGGPASQGMTTTVILVRHAEKAVAGDPELSGAPRNDPPLNATGRDRARALARTLEEAGVTAIYASEFARTQQTVEPLAEILGVEVMTHPAADTDGLVEILRAGHSGGVVVIAGHSNTVPAIIEALGAGPVEAIEDAWEYDNLYVVVVEASGHARVSTLKYGAASNR